MAAATLEELRSKVTTLTDAIVGKSKEKSKTDKTPAKEKVFGDMATIRVRKGENIMGSRGFQFQRLIGVVGKRLAPESAKIELMLCNELRDELVRNQWEPGSETVAVAPFATSLMGSNQLWEEQDEPQQGLKDDFVYQMKSMVRSGVEGTDYDEARWTIRKMAERMGINYEGKTAQSWIDETLGGSLVAPPEFGELIQLLRNKDALINLGARVVPLPPSGRLKYPRQTTPTTGYWVGENQSITTSNFGTGALVLSAKKVATLVQMPNELIRFASPASEAILRADMTKTLSLTLDYGLLYGEGSDNIPLGLAIAPNLYDVAVSGGVSGVGVNGNTIYPQDLPKFIAGIEANNAEFQGWLMRPEMFYQFVGARAAVYNGATVGPQGQFTFDQFRQLGTGFPKIVMGFPCVTTPQVSITQSKGTASNLTTVFGGQWDDYVIAMFGSIEFAQATQGDTAFAQDQTVVRAILTADGAARHPSAFAKYDQVLQTIGQ